MPRLNKSTISIIAVIAIAFAIYVWQPRHQQGGSGTPLVQVVIPDLSVRAKAGEVLFRANCAACHGTNAAGQDGVAPPLVHKIYEPNHHSDISFQRAAKYGVRAHHWRFGNMPPVPGVSDNEISKIIAYVRELQRANGIY